LNLVERFFNAKQNGEPAEAGLSQAGRQTAVRMSDGARRLLS
jgi:hypothetical protein